MLNEIDATNNCLAVELVKGDIKMSGEESLVTHHARLARTNALTSLVKCD